MSLPNKMRLLATKQLGLFPSELHYTIQAVRGIYQFFADIGFDEPFGLRVEIIDMDQREAMIKLPNTGYAVVPLHLLSPLER